MTQISRPFQIGLAAVVLLAGVWLIALRGHSSSSESSSTPAPSSTQRSQGSQGSSSSSGGTSSTYKGAAPGVAGLSNAIAKAHGAVGTSQQNAKALEEKSNQASSNGGSGSTATAPSSQSAQAAPTTTGSSPSTAAPKTSSKPAPGASTQTAVNRQQAVEGALASGNVVLLLFWDKKGADDVAVHNAVRSVAGSEHKLVVQEAPASQVASFGSITRGVAVFGTPTVLIVGRHGRTTAITGLTDSYSLQQAIDDARKS